MGHVEEGQIDLSRSSLSPKREAHPGHFSKSTHRAWSILREHWRTTIRLLLVIGLTYQLQWRALSEPLCAGISHDRDIPNGGIAIALNILMGTQIRSDTTDGAKTKAVRTSAAAAQSASSSERFESLSRYLEIVVPLLAEVWLFLDICKPVNLGISAAFGIGCYSWEFRSLYWPRSPTRSSFTAGGAPDTYQNGLLIMPRSQLGADILSLV